MGNKTYINLIPIKKGLYKHLYVEDGVRKSEEITATPFYGYHSQNGKLTDIYGKPATMKKFDSVDEANLWRRNQKETGTEVLGEIAYFYQFIAFNYRGEIKPQREAMNIYNLDIEVYSGDGFPKPEEALYPVVAITVQDMNKNKYLVLGLTDYVNNEPNVKYIKCKDEKELLNKFLTFCEINPFDIITGWNILNFDIKYLVNRISSQLGKQAVKRLSPTGKINTKTYLDEDGEVEDTWYEIDGVVHYDYMMLYKKFKAEKQEKYTLDYISQLELGEQKLSYHNEYESLNELYEKDPQKYMDYNVRDVELIYLLEKRLKFIDLALYLVYMAKCKLEDIFTTIPLWESLLYNELLKKKILVPQRKVHMKADFVGGYTSRPNKGMRKWITVYDISSSYPNTIISYNISPEKIYIPKEDDLINIANRYTNEEKYLDLDTVEKEVTPILKKYGVCMTPNGNFFKNDGQGLLPEITEQLFNERKRVKKLASDIQEKMEEMADKTTVEYDLMLNEFTSLDLKQYALKIALNSLFGAVANIHCTFYDIRMAESITKGGRFSAMGVGRYIKTVDNLINDYQDTDSIFINVADKIPADLETNDEIIDWIIKYQEATIEPAIKQYFSRALTALNTYKKSIKMEYECIADKTLFKEAKKYVMHMLDKEKIRYKVPKLKIKGIEVSSSSTPMLIREKLKKIVGMLFTNNEEEIINEIEMIKADFYQQPFEKIAFPRSIKNMKKYALGTKGSPIQVKAAHIGNRLIHQKGLEANYEIIKEGNKAYFIYVKQPNIANTEVIAFMYKIPEEVKDQLSIDYDTQWYKVFFKPISGLAEAAGIQIIKIENSLEDYFC